MKSVPKGSRKQLSSRELQELCEWEAPFPNQEGPGIWEFGVEGAMAGATMADGGGDLDAHRTGR